MNQKEFRLVHNQKEKYPSNHIPLNQKRTVNLFLWVWASIFIPSFFSSFFGQTEDPVSGSELLHPLSKTLLGSRHIEGLVELPPSNPAIQHCHDIRGLTERTLIVPPWCREASTPRKTPRLIAEEVPNACQLLSHACFAPLEKNHMGCPRDWQLSTSRGPN